jgi:hypothetical protein
MKSPIVKFVGMVTWLITALCSLHVGMQALGHDLFARLGLEGNVMVNAYVPYIVGVSGAISLLMFVMALFCHGCGNSDNKNGSCSSKVG